MVSNWLKPKCLHLTIYKSIGPKQTSLHIELFCFLILNILFVTRLTLCLLSCLPVPTHTANIRQTSHNLAIKMVAATFKNKNIFKYFQICFQIFLRQPSHHLTNKMLTATQILWKHIFFEITFARTPIPFMLLTLRTLKINCWDAKELSQINQSIDKLIYNMLYLKKSYFPRMYFIWGCLTKHNFWRRRKLVFYQDNS